MSEVTFNTAIPYSASTLNRLNYGLEAGYRIQGILVRKMASSLGFPMERGFIADTGEIYNPFKMYQHDLRVLDEDETKAISVLADTYKDTEDTLATLRIRMCRCFNKADNEYEKMYVINGLYGQSIDFDEEWVSSTFKAFVKNEDCQTPANQLATLLMLQGGAL
ncbi:hypothetical protein VPHD518_0038 [Vibrio phage D518]